VTLGELEAEPLDGRFRALGTHPGLTVADVAAQGWSVPHRDVPFPVMALDDGALEHNLGVVHGWCAERGVSIAPHGKTTLAPALIRRQLAAGAWGMTAANVHQAGVMAVAGAERVVLASELGSTAEAERLEALCRAAGIEAFVFVDSRAGVEALAAVEREQPLAVLLELGAPGGRAGVRTDEEARAVADAVAASSSLRLAGLAAWEGGLPGQAEVDALLLREDALAGAFDAEGRFETEEILLSAGGSIFFDRVVEALRGDGLSRPVRVVLRSGCYLTHDHGIYAERSPLRADLRPALQLWAEVISLPEPGLAIAGFGKRDAPYDLGLPVVEAVVDRAGARSATSTVTVTTVNDQHAFLAHDGALAVGDLVVCGISHPCTAFDKWSLLPLIDGDGTVTGAVRTLF
jgi:D-serine deaminase-like pyridoxal phosphate-dependent protein